MKCFNCSAELRFDPKSQGLVCDSCDSRFDVDSYEKQAKTVQAGKGYEDNFVVYVCQSCGAKLMGEANEVAPFCHYCGSQNMIDSGDSAFKPDLIIPFQIDKEECKNKYREAISSVKFVPKDLKDSQYLDGFRGIYIPYYRYFYTAEGQATVEYKRDHKLGGRKHEVTEYKDTCNIAGPFHVNDKDAEFGLDDSITQQISPYDNDAYLDFKNSYVAGFYADKPDIEASVYDKKNTEEGRELIINKLDGTKTSSETTVTNRDISEVDINETGIVTSLRPTWFLTWRKSDRMLYSVMNGQTGKVFADLPIDFKSYLGFGAIMSAIVFVIMWIITLICPMTPAKAMLISASVGALVMFMGGMNVKQYERRLKSGVNDGSLRSNFSTNGGILFIAIVIAIMICSIFEDLVFLFYLFPPAFSIAAFAMSVASCVRIKQMGQFVLSLITMIVATLSPYIAILDLRQDVIYYLISAGFIVMGVLSTYLMFIRYNLLVTHPIPNFFDREGGDNDAN